MPESKHIPFNELLTQSAELQAICSACSTYNWLKIAGAPVEPQVGDNLIQQVLDTRKSISSEQAGELATEFGFETKQFFLPDNVVTLNSFYEKLLPILDQSPILFSMSTYLSKKDRSITPEISYKDMEGYSKQLVVHAAVCAKDPETDLAYIIDPYSPQNPEQFDVTLDPDKLELASWLMSSLFQFRMERKNNASRETILEEARSVIADPIRVENGYIFTLGLGQAKAQYLLPLSSDKD